jgi:hypothetical protein
MARDVVVEHCAQEGRIAMGVQQVHRAITQQALLLALEVDREILTLTRCWERVGRRPRRSCCR